MDFQRESNTPWTVAVGPRSSLNDGHSVATIEMIEQRAVPHAFEVGAADGAIADQNRVQRDLVVRLHGETKHVGGGRLAIDEAKERRQYVLNVTQNLEPVGMFDGVGGIHVGFLALRSF